ncbi:hypothetical protein QCA50_007922 [Cerrena zonata]|uniref:Uncharacterized protein n=1 Tax=Cerrena zonata TaxID=2478898 RepID=A0AAW0G8Z3_9APHY
MRSSAPNSELPSRTPSCIVDKLIETLFFCGNHDPTPAPTRYDTTSLNLGSFFAINIPSSYLRLLGPKHSSAPDIYAKSIVSFSPCPCPIDY